VTNICPKCLTPYAKPEIKTTRDGKTKYYCPYCNCELPETKSKSPVRHIRRPGK